MGELKDILQRLEPSLGALSGEPVALAGGITNRNVRVTLGGTDYVVRCPGKDTGLLGINRAVERLATDTAAQLGIAPPVAGAVEDCLVTRFVACRAMSMQEIASGAAEVARALRCFHDSPVSLSAKFWVPDLLDDYARIVLERGGTLPSGYAEAVSVAARIEACLPLSRPRPCHDDLLSGNIIRAQDDGRMMLVDWEYAGMGDPRFDLGNLSINNDFDAAADERLLAAYYEEAPTDARRAALNLMRVLSDAREAAWGVVQSEVSALDYDFDGYAQEHFDRLHEAAVQPLFEEWLATAA